MSILEKLARGVSFNSWEYTIGDIRDICEKIGHNSNRIRSEILSLVEASLGFQTLLIVWKTIRF